ncbi:MAG: lysine biosynthesis protein LysW [Chloroflexi bacterium]|nr:lysine biosynthesis protein LysW [Chloroflexota bacterium]
MMTTCPECEGALALADDVQTGEIVVCGDCGVDLEVIDLAPLALALAPQEAEDWGE